MCNKHKYGVPLVAIIFASILTAVLAGSPLQIPEQEPFYYTEETTMGPRYVIPDYRLPANLIPSHYTVRINPKIEDGSTNQYARGSIIMRVDCKEETNEVVLHANAIQIDEDSIEVNVTKLWHNVSHYK